jgi:hypothetical protein
MTTSSGKAGVGRRVGRYDTWIMVTGVAMFLLSFAPWEGLNPESASFLGVHVPVSLGSIYNAWQVNFGGWLPCLVALAIAGAVAVHDFFGVQVAGVAGARPRFLLQVAAAISTLLLSVRAISLFVQHNPNVGQARWGVYLAFVVGVTQFAFVLAGRTKIGHVTASAGLSGSPGPGRASTFCARCGTRAAAGDNFCQQCGAPVANGAASHPPGSPARS